MRQILKDVLGYVRERFELSEDNAPQHEVIDNIRRGVEFKGINLWVLVFAIFIACLGLNVNSTAVIIGAMLISPLMGPIIGVGLSLGINDFELLKNSVRNFFLMVVVSLVSATLFFLLFQPGSNQSELLARTTPTTNDVFIALFGGLAGMVAQTRKDRTPTVISGVAIATALMPPLCTAGFGIATGQWNFFLGAFYLFTINVIFISIATYLMTIFLKYDKKVFLDSEREKRVKTIMAVIVVLVTIPSVVIGLGIMNRSSFENNADKFVNQVFQGGESYMLMEHSADYRHEGKKSRIQVRLLGDGVTEDLVDMARAQMANYGLKDVELVVHQTDFGGERVDFSNLQKGYSDIIEEKNNRIAELEQRMSRLTVSDTVAMRDISREMGAVFDNVTSVSVERHVRHNMSGEPTDTVVVGLLKIADAEHGVDTARIISWLSTRMKSEDVELFFEK